MRYEQIIVLSIVVITILYLHNMIQKQKIEKGIQFCEKVENIIRIYQEAFGVEVGNITYKYETQIDYYIIAYDSKNPKSFFMQLELGIADALDEYDKIKDFEFDYVEEDWQCITEHYEGLSEMENRVRHEMWKRGFKKV